MFSQNVIPFPGRVADTPHLTLIGRVAQEKGQPSNSGQVVLNCQGEDRGESSIDSGGNFALSVTVSGQGDSGPQPFQASDSTFASVGAPESFVLAACDLVVQADGFANQSFPLTQLDNESGVVSVGTLVLDRPRTASNGISGNTFTANPRARSEFEKGLKDEKKGNLSHARSKFQKALSLDRRFAAAWYQLGRINVQENKGMDARYCFQQALQIDPAFTQANLVLADIALKTEQWRDLLTYSNQLTASPSVDSPWAWLVNSIANFQLGFIAKAQESANNGLKLDARHHYPKLEYILGLALARRQAYASAAEHLEKFVKLVPKEVNPAVRKQVADVEALARKVSASR